MNCLIEGYILTGNIQYKNRASEMMQNFVNEFVWDMSNLIWHYWPQSFYDGWTIDMGLSDNTPFKDPSIDTLYEDLSHASINILAIHKFKTIDPEYKILPRSVIEGLNSTLSTIMKTRYSRFMKLSTDTGYESLEYFPHAYWALLKNELLRETLSDTIPSSYIYNEFDMVQTLTYLLGIQSLDNFTVRIMIRENDGTWGKNHVISTPSDFVSYMSSVSK